MIRLWSMNRWAHARTTGAWFSPGDRSWRHGNVWGVCMDREISAPSVAMQGLAELKYAARWQAIRESTSTELLRLVLRLEHACEVARVAALRNLHRSGQGADFGGDADRTLGFATLYAALRRARAETRRREARGPRPPSPAVGNDGAVVRAAQPPGGSSAPPPRGS